VYDATHFTLALPADWQVQVNNQPDTTMTRAHPIYILSTAPDDANGWVYEWDGLTPEQVHNEFCTPTADDRVVTVGGRPMRFSVGYPPLNTSLPYDPFAYDWTFISNHGTVYWFYFYVGPDGSVGPNVQLDRAVIATFAPQYATSGCA
jgi:hypothetical protein